MLFYEGTNQITFQYQDVNFGNVLYDNGAGATVGIKGSTIQYSFNAAALSDLLAIQFTPIVPPNIDVSPSSLAATQLPNTTTQQTLTIANNGGSPLNWQIAEDPVLVAPVGPAPEMPAPAAGTNGSRGGAPDATQPIQYTSPASFSEGFDRYHGAARLGFPEQLLAAGPDQLVPGQHCRVQRPGWPGQRPTSAPTSTTPAAPAHQQLADDAADQPEQRRHAVVLDTHQHRHRFLPTACKYA